MMILIMKRKEQDKHWQELLSRTDKDGEEYKKWVVKIGKDYLEKKKKRSILTRIFVLIFGDPNILGENIIKEYGRHNIISF